MKHGDKIKQEILEAGLKIWAVDPLGLSARALGRKLNMTHANVLYHFDDLESLRNAIADYAVQTGNSRVIVQLLAMNHPAVWEMSPADQRKHSMAVRK